MSRLDVRSRDTAACPTRRHEHRWTHHLRGAQGPAVEFSVSRQGVVEVSEEALMALLRMAGYQPSEETP